MSSLDLSYISKRQTIYFQLPVCADVLGEHMLICRSPSLLNLMTSDRWRFALIEMQAIIVALIEDFEFSMPPKECNIEIVRKPLGIMSPMIKSRLNEGVLMPLIVKAL